MNTTSQLDNSTANLDPQVLNHPAGLFILFFTEMWERFSYYGMRALLVLFLVTAIDGGGWGWSRENAAILYAWYTGLVYLTPLVGGWIADKFWGFKTAVVVGALLMTLGHAALAVETVSSFYLGLGLLIVGNGLFKPNISSMVGGLYKDDTKKDGAYTIFYMGINAGAFLGIMLCGYVGETVGWSYGFGLAGVFMFFGLLQFYFAQSVFGDNGAKPQKAIDLDPSEVADTKLTNIEKDRIIVIGVLSLFVIVFWWAFEQAGSSMTIFAKDYTQRVLTGSTATIYVWANFFLTVVPILVVTWVLGLLFKQTFKTIPLSNAFLGFSFVLIWAIVIWKVYTEFSSASEIEVPASWFGILNSFFIITLAPLFSKIWESKYNPSGPAKFALGLIFAGIGFAFLAYGAMGIESGASTASVSMFWLIAAYFFHTTGELCLSPVGLSYVSKLTPKRLLGLMFGVWFLANFFANLLGGLTASTIDAMNEAIGLSGFFLVFTAIPIAAGLIMFIISPFLKKRMHGIH
ncbi:peptide MFS transporter [Marinicella sp. S1101]|uniref:peptide MFS transporter n=1 Tax=Marinicella marina TaxID=2996016 RepID=UPI002260869F|nr:peptide MFS transporter [Marinicella marina]MCX7552703.1 peptide MFS transporter [Marinicella marina]MDJ1139988.1 peptide MFS transporter [Marinicella marina]